MNLQRIVFKCLAMFFVVVMFFKSVLVLPSVSAQAGNTPTPSATPTVIDIDQDGLADNESGLLSTADSPAVLQSQSVTAYSIGMIATGLDWIPRNRLISLGYSVTTIPPTSGLGTFQQYDIVYLPVGWADANNGNYETIETYANDYRSYVYQGGSLFLDQPNPYLQPNDTVTPSP